MTSKPPSPTSTLSEAKEQLRTIEYDLACVIVPKLVSDDKIRPRLGDALSMLNGLQDRFKTIEAALESVASSQTALREKVEALPVEWLPETQNRDEAWVKRSAVLKILSEASPKESRILDRARDIADNLKV